MQKAKAFFFVCAGIFLLALSYHFGATSAGAQAPANPIVAAFQSTYGSNAAAAVAANGDFYETTDFTNWSRVGNVFAAGPVPAANSTWGQLKAKYR